jgi:hypothetical protein
MHCSCMTAHFALLFLRVTFKELIMVGQTGCTEGQEPVIATSLSLIRVYVHICYHGVLT